MSLWERIKRLFRAETHAQLDKMEDAVKMTDQGLRELREKLAQGQQGLAQAKAAALQEKKLFEDEKRASADYEQKAMLLLQKAQKGEISAEEADRLAALALEKKQQLQAVMETRLRNIQQYDAMTEAMTAQIQKLKDQINTWEAEAKMLKAKAKVNEAALLVNKSLAGVDANDTVAMLEKMKSKVDEQGALAESYGQIANANTSLDDQLNKALGPSAATSSAALLELKAKMAAQNPAIDAGKSADAPASGADSAPLSDLDKLKQQLRDNQ